MGTLKGFWSIRNSEKILNYWLSITCSKCDQIRSNWNVTNVHDMRTFIYKFGLSVCLYPINVKTAEPIGPKFFVGHLGNPGKVYEWSKFQIFVSIKIRSSLNFWKFWKSTKFFVKIHELFLFCFTMYTKRTCSQLI